MDRTAKGQRVGVTVNELDDKGKRKDIAPRFFGEVTRVEGDNDQSIYVRIDGAEDETHFHVSELELEPAPAKSKK